MRLACLLAVAMAAAACGLIGAPNTISSTSCTGLPSGACDEQVQHVAAGLSNVTQVDVMCAPEAACTRASGHGTADVTLANGQKLTRAWSYVGDPAPVPAPVCIGLPQPTCQSQADGQVDAVAPSKHIVGITVTCTKNPCREAGGEAEVKVLLGDGSVQTTGSSWTSQ
jgi:hypothetical protein